MTRYDENEAPTYVLYPVTSGKTVSYELGWGLVGRNMIRCDWIWNAWVDSYLHTSDYAPSYQKYEITAILQGDYEHIWILY